MCVTEYEQLCIMYEKTRSCFQNEAESGTHPLSPPTSSFLPSLTLSNLLISQDVETAVLHTYFIQDGYQLPTEPWVGGTGGRKCQQ